MPVDTAYYKDNDFIPEEDGIVNTGQSFRFVQKTFDKVKKETFEEDQDRSNALTNSSAKEALLNDKDSRTES